MVNESGGLGDVCNAVGCVSEANKTVILMNRNRSKNSRFPNRGLWAESYSRFNTNPIVDLFKLECKDDDRVAIYVSKDRITSGRFGNEDMLGRLPVYHVWVGDKHVYCGQSMSEAYGVYNAVNSRQ